MAFEDLLIHTVNISTPTVPDPDDTNRYGDPDEGATVTTGVACRVDPAGGSEDLDNAETRISKFRIFFKPDAVIDGTSTFTWLGRTLRATQEPESFYDSDSLHHFEIDAEEVQG